MDYGPSTIDSLPKQLRYRFPAEWEKHEATWLSWPHKEESWPGKIDSIYPIYAQFIKVLAESEKVRINVADEVLKNFALKHIINAGADLSKIEFYFHPSNDAWCRDHGPAFLINPNAEHKKIIIEWGFNAWGGKYPPFDLDDVIPTLIGEHFQSPVFNPGIIGMVIPSSRHLFTKSKYFWLSKNIWVTTYSAPKSCFIFKYFKSVFKLGASKCFSGYPATPIQKLVG